MKILGGRHSILWLVLLGFLASSAIASSDDHGEPKHIDDHGHGDESEHHKAITLTPGAETALGVVRTEAAAGIVYEQVSLPGEIQLNREAVAHIVPRFSGKVRAVNARIGDQVEAGAVLAVMESSETLASFELRSLIAGTIINRHITLGEVLGNTDTAFVVADLSTLWLDLAIYPRYLAEIKTGQSLTVESGSQTTTAVIDYVSPLVNEATRTGLARVFLSNDAGLWRPGQFVTAKVQMSETRAEVVVPLSAVVTLAGKNSVFVDEAGQWLPVPVETGLSDDKNQVITQGLRPGQIYASRGAFVLKSEREKSEFDSGHNH